MMTMMTVIIAVRKSLGLLYWRSRLYHSVVI